MDNAFIVFFNINIIRDKSKKKYVTLKILKIIIFFLLSSTIIITIFAFQPEIFSQI